MKSKKLFMLVVLFLASCTPPATPTQTFTPVLTATQTPTSTPTVTPAPTQVGGGSGRLIFEYSSAEFKKDFPDLKGNNHVFIANVDGTNITLVTNGFDGSNFLKDISPDGAKALIVSTSKQESNIYVFNLNSLDREPFKLAKGSDAKWLDNTRIVYIGQGEKGSGIYTINVDGTNSVNIENGNKPLEILGINKDRVYWNTLIDNANGNQHYYTYYVSWTNLDGSATGQLIFKGKTIGTSNFLGRDLVFSPDGTRVAWMEKATATFHHDYLHIASVSDTEHPSSIDLMTSEVDLKWQLDGKSILVFDWGAVGGSDKSNNMYGFYEISDSGTVIKNYHLSDDVMGGFGSSLMRCSNISPDNQLLPCLTFGKDKNADGFIHAKLNFLNLDTSVFSGISGFNFVFMCFCERRIFWIP